MTRLTRIVVRLTRFIGASPVWAACELVCVEYLVGSSGGDQTRQSERPGGVSQSGDGRAVALHVARCQTQ